MIDIGLSGVKGLRGARLLGNRKFALIILAAVTLFTVANIFFANAVWSTCSSKPEWLSACASAWQAFYTIVLVGVAVGVPVVQWIRERSRDSEDRLRRAQAAALIFLPILERWIGFVSSAERMLLEAAQSGNALLAMQVPDAPNLMRAPDEVIAFVDRFHELGKAGNGLSALVFESREVAKDIVQFPRKHGHGRAEQTQEDWTRIAQSLIDRTGRIALDLVGIRRLLRLSLGEAPF